MLNFLHYSFFNPYSLYAKLSVLGQSFTVFNIPKDVNLWASPVSATPVKVPSKDPSNEIAVTIHVTLIPPVVGWLSIIILVELSYKYNRVVYNLKVIIFCHKFYI